MNTINNEDGFADYLNGRLTETECVEFERRINDDPEFARLYAEHIRTLEMSFLLSLEDRMPEEELGDLNGMILLDAVERGAITSPQVLEAIADSEYYQELARERALLEAPLSPDEEEAALAFLRSGEEPSTEEAAPVQSPRRAATIRTLGASKLMAAAAAVLLLLAAGWWVWTSQSTSYHSDPQWAEVYLEGDPNLATISSFLDRSTGRGIASASARDAGARAYKRKEYAEAERQLRKYQEGAVEKQDSFTAPLLLAMSILNQKELSQEEITEALSILNTLPSSSKQEKEMKRWYSILTMLMLEDRYEEGLDELKKAAGEQGFMYQEPAEKLLNKYL